MEKINFRIQRRNNLNEIYVDPNRQKESNGTHNYKIKCERKNSEGLVTYAENFYIRFQNGPRNEEGSVIGVIDSDLLEIVRHRLQGFQSGAYATREGALALTAVEEALMWLAKRSDDRDERGVLGTMKK